MDFTVEDLLQADLLKNAKLLGGEHGLNRQILSGTIIEAPDIVKFINGGEVLLTGLYAFQGCTLEQFKEYIYQLPKKNVSAILLKRGRSVTFVKEKIGFLLDFSNTYGIPVVEIPFEISFRDILSLVMQRLFNEEVTRLKYFKTTHDNFAVLPFSSDSAESGIAKILYMLGQMVGNGVAIFNQNMECLAATEDGVREFLLDSHARRIDPGLYSAGVYLQQENLCGGEYEKRGQSVVWLDIVFDIRLYLVVTETQRQVGGLDYIAIENALTALKYEFFRQYSLEELEKKYENDLTSNLLNGKIKTLGDLKKNRKVKLLNMPIDASYRVIVLRFESDGKESRDFEASVRQMNILGAAVRKNLPDVWQNRDMECLAAIQMVDQSVSQKAQRIELREAVERIQKQIFVSGCGFRVKAGVGKTVKDIVNISESYQEAKDTMIFLDISKGLSEDASAPVMFFSDLGIFNLLSQIKEPQVLMQYVPESLQKLYEYKLPQRRDLITTLSTYLERNRNLTKTAQDLYIHYKTAAYRMKKISDITGMDFENSNEILAVRIGLVVYKMIENQEKKGHA